jgi:hypothetical protein
MNGGIDNDNIYFHQLLTVTLINAGVTTTPLPENSRNLSVLPVVGTPDSEPVPKSAAPPKRNMIAWRRRLGHRGP